MKFKKIFFANWMISNVVFFSISCSNPKNEPRKYDQKLFDWIYNKSQLDYLIQNNLFFTKNNTGQNNEQIDNLKAQKENLFLKKLSNNLELLYQTNGINIQELRVFSSASSLNSIKKDLFNNSPFFPNLQYAIFDIFANKNLFKSILPNWISSDNIREQAFFQNNEQIQYLEKILTFYLRAFDIENFTFARILLNNDQTISISLKNQQNQDLYSKWKQVKFFLPNFRDLNQRKTWNRNFNLFINDNQVLLNEQFNDVDLFFKNNPLLIDSFETIIENVSILRKISSKGLLVLLKYLKDYINISSPNLNSKLMINFEKSLQIPDHLPLNNSSLIVPIVVHDNQKSYKWYSLDFSKHHHVLSGYYTSNNLNYDKNFDYSLNTFGQFAVNNQMKINSSLRLENFINTNLQKIFNYFLYINKDNASIWNGNKMQDFEPDQFNDILLRQNPLEWIIAQVAVVLNSYLFDFENSQGYSPLYLEINKIQTNPQVLGQVNLRLDVIDLKQNKKILTINNIKIGGLKGFDYSDIDQFNNTGSLDLNIYPQFYK
ncbi:MULTISPECIES: MAG3240 family lipoprotein [unclassified Mycoplasma]|uniref:MAG3240 family lipoprotein n=1 Tax=unclassified Mycoplasma TaxID=2683645 RepID=UPI00211CE742|nr:MULTISPECIES: hypothetical protein [unclassified Mycoplasma]UUM19947.1 hypothetical protein NPA11_00705 [Mycoplasma sp. 1578d]UUM24928.1 hypothetical protein NPA12_00690 [Mycoplasma sp. 3686d]